MITATDADKPDTLHTKLVYSILKQEPYDGTYLFSIDKYSGAIRVKENTLDREVSGVEFHILFTNKYNTFVNLVNWKVGLTS